MHWRIPNLFEHETLATIDNISRMSNANMYSLRGSRPLGMQVHAIPDAERFVDNTGRKLPWGYEYTAGASIGDSDQQEEQEKGPFGRSTRRSRNNFSRSRSKTAEPRREEDRHRAENLAAEEAVFGSLRRAVLKEDGRRDIADHDAAMAAARALSDTELEPTEVLLYGFGADMQWAAIDFYERVSNGRILEDYDRQPPNSRYDASLALGRAAAQNTLSKAAMRKRNRYAGGKHWIKVTFESRQAAELAIASGPHIIKGYLVYAEPYQNRGPQRDEPVVATQAGVQVTSDVLPQSFSTNPMEISPNRSSTLSSATATATGTSGLARSHQGVHRFSEEGSPTSSASTVRGSIFPHEQRAEPPPANAMARAHTSSFQVQADSSARQPQPRRTRIEGTTQAVVLPADMALAPKQPKASWSSWMGAGEIIGSAVPRQEDGSFDWNRASLYWRIFFWIDLLFGTDFCGLRADD